MTLRNFDLRTLILLGLCASLVVLICIVDPQDTTWLGLYTGMFTCVLTVLILDLYDKFKLSSDLNYLSSEKWVGYRLEGREVKKHKTEDGSVEFNSFATVKYLRDNILSISLRHRKNASTTEERSWNGIIEMNRQSLTKGSLTFKYLDSHEVGYREILVHRDNDRIYIYMIPSDNKIYYLEKSDDKLTPEYDYGTEVLIME